MVLRSARWNIILLLHLLTIVAGQVQNSQDYPGTGPLTGCDVQLLSPGAIGLELGLYAICESKTVITSLDLGLCIGAAGTRLTCGLSGVAISCKNCQLQGMSLSCACGDSVTLTAVDITTCVGYSTTAHALTCTGSGGQVGMTMVNPFQNAQTSCTVTMPAGGTGGLAAPLQAVCQTAVGGAVTSLIDMQNCFGYQQGTGYYPSFSGIIPQSGGNAFSVCGCTFNQGSMTLLCSCRNPNDPDDFTNTAVPITSAISWGFNALNCFNYVGSVSSNALAAPIGGAYYNNAKCTVAMPAPAGGFTLQTVCQTPLGEVATSTLDLNQCLGDSASITCQEDGNAGNVCPTCSLIPLSYGVGYQFRCTCYPYGGTDPTFSFFDITKCITLSGFNLNCFAGARTGVLSFAAVAPPPVTTTTTTSTTHATTTSQSTTTTTTTTSASPTYPSVSGPSASQAFPGCTLGLLPTGSVSGQTIPFQATCPNTLTNQGGTITSEIDLGLCFVNSNGALAAAPTPVSGGSGRQKRTTPGSPASSCISIAFNSTTLVLSAICQTNAGQPQLTAIDINPTVVWAFSDTLACLQYEGTTVFNLPGSSSSTSSGTASRTSTTMTSSSTVTAPTSTTSTSSAPTSSPSSPGSIDESGKLVGNSQWSYTGCFVDSSSRVLGSLLSDVQDQTIESCFAQCSAAGYTYCGLEYANQCFGSMTLNAPSGSQQDGFDCTYACSGNSAETCGGDFAIDVYQAAYTTYGSTGIANMGTWTYSGCFSDYTSSVRALVNDLSSEFNGTIEGCLTACADQGYSFCGVEDGNQCFGDNVVNTAVATPLVEESCQDACSGNSNERCGGYFAIGIYSAFGMTSPTPTSSSTTQSTSSSMSSSPGVSSTTASTVTTTASTTTTTSAQTPTPLPTSLHNCELFLLPYVFGEGLTLPLEAYCPNSAGGDTGSYIDLTTCFGSDNNGNLQCSQTTGNGLLCDPNRCAMWGTTLSCPCFDLNNDSWETSTTDMASCLTYGNDGVLSCFGSEGTSFTSIPALGTVQVQPSPTPLVPINSNSLSPSVCNLEIVDTNGYYGLTVQGTCPNSSGGSTTSTLDLGQCTGIDPVGNLLCSLSLPFVCKAGSCTVTGSVLTCPCLDFSTRQSFPVSSLDLTGCVGYNSAGTLVCSGSSVTAPSTSSVTSTFSTTSLSPSSSTSTFITTRSSTVQITTTSSSKQATTTSSAPPSSTSALLAVGAPCSSDASCSSGYCITKCLDSSTSGPKIAVPGHCHTDYNCGSSALCFGNGLPNSTDSFICVRTNTTATAIKCSSATNCPAGYGCRSTGTCYPLKNAWDPCVNPSDCSGGICLSPSLVCAPSSLVSTSSSTSVSSTSGGVPLSSFSSSGTFSPSATTSLKSTSLSSSKTTTSAPSATTTALLANGGVCSSDYLCASLWCLNSRCTDSSTSGPKVAVPGHCHTDYNCGSSAQCFGNGTIHSSDSLICVRTNTTITSTKCTTAATCPSGAGCRSGACYTMKNPYDPCTIASDCTTGTCSPSTLTCAPSAVGGSCQSTTDCQSGSNLICRSNLCVAQLANGAVCSTDYSCLSGYCITKCLDSSTSGPKIAVPGHCHTDYNCGSSALCFGNGLPNSSDSFVCVKTNTTITSTKCTTDSNCPTGAGCRSGACHVYKQAYDPCVLSSDCASGVCSTPSLTCAAGSAASIPTTSAALLSSSTTSSKAASTSSVSASASSASKSSTTTLTASSVKTSTSVLPTSTLSSSTKSSSSTTSSLKSSTTPILSTTTSSSLTASATPLAAIGKACTSDSSCVSSYCVAGKCVDSSTSGPKIAAPGHCHTDYNCGSAALCYGNGLPNDSDSFICVKTNSTITATKCTTGATCPQSASFGAGCRSGACYPFKGPYDPCLINTDCSTGTCVPSSLTCSGST